MKLTIQAYVFSALVLLVNVSFAIQPAFPTAQGFGAIATGGRGGTVYHVTNLNDAGAGSLRDGCSKTGRTVVFDIGGIIKESSRIEIASNVTIAGQTAPGGGIVVYGYGLGASNSSNVIVRYVTMLGSINMPEDKCVWTADNTDGVIVDHCTIGWGRWDNVHISNGKNITLQYCIVGESIDPQRFGALLEGPTNLSIHHCLWIDNQSRNPKGKADMQYINNVVYNFGTAGFVGGHSAADHHQDIISNYFISGPNSSASYLSDFTATDHAYHKGNFVDIDKDGTLNGRLISDADFTAVGAAISATPYSTAPLAITTQSAADAFTIVSAQAGSSLHRTSIDTRLLGQLKTLGKQGTIIHSETEVPAIGTISAGTPLTDTDSDGMPDVWEKANNLSATDATDRNKIGTDGYTMLEIYLNSLTQDSPVGVIIKNAITTNAQGYATLQITQNVFATKATIHFSVQKPTPVTITMYTLAGKQVATIIHNTLTSSGNHQISWDGKNSENQHVVPGMYVCSLKTNENTVVKKISLLAQ